MCVCVDVLNQFMYAIAIDVVNNKNIRYRT